MISISGQFTVYYLIRTFYTLDLILIFIWSPFVVTNSCFRFYSILTFGLFIDTPFWIPHSLLRLSIRIISYFLSLSSMIFPSPLYRYDDNS
jgi:hypothetical protein